MIDFMVISTRSTKRGVIEIYPKFIIKKSTDLMIRGGDFYAIWIEERGLWSTDEQDALQLIDRELDRYAEENRQRFNSDISGNEWRMLEMCEEDEKLKLPLVVAGQRRSVNFVTENGLYNILAQSRMEIARSWRRVVHDELINMRKEKGRNIAEQFEEWDHAMDNIYFDEETGQLMQSVTVPGGDVIQIPYEKEEE